MGLAMTIEDLRKNGMMAYLLDALDGGQDIGHYGRLVFAMVARYFLTEQELLDYLQKDPTVTLAKARALAEQVKSKDYCPPSRERVMEWQKEQDFPICPAPDDPDACNVYRDLHFPYAVYQDIEDYQEQKAESHLPKEAPA